MSTKKLSTLRFVATVWSGEWKWIAYASGAMVAASLIQLAIPLGVKKLVDTTDSFDSRTLAFDCGVVIGVVCTYHIVSLVGHLIAYRVTLLVNYSMMSDGLDKICRSGEWQIVAKSSPAELCHMISSASDTCGTTLATLITELLTSVIAAIGILAVVLYISWELTLIFILVVGATQVFSHFYERGFKTPVAAKQVREAGRLTALLTNYIQRKAAIQIFDATSLVRQRFAEQAQRSMSTSVALNFQIHFHAAVSSMVTNSLFVALVGMAVFLKSVGYLSFFDIGIFFFYMKQLLDRVLTVAGEFRRVSVLLGKIEEYQAFSKLLNADNISPMAKSLDAESNPMVVLEKISFVYDAASERKNDQSCVKDFSMTVSCGEFVGLVGPSGCGKSTILKIVAGLLRPQCGTVEVFSRVALLEQSPSILIGSVRENISIGRGVRPSSFDEICSASKKAGCHDFISALPDGYETIIQNADQAQFSGGQLQRICLARVFLSDARVILLDEPTTGLDPAASKVVLDSAVALKNEGRAVVFASHDEEALKMADRCMIL